MLKYLIRTYGDPVLRLKSTIVENHEFKELSDMLKDTLKETGGIGLSAIQIGLTKRIFVLKKNEDEYLTLINPEILEITGIKTVEEGCLSFPGLFSKLERPEKVVVKALNEEGLEFTHTLDGMYAQAASHEIDHLDGILFTDRLNKFNKMLAQNKMEIISKKTKKLLGKYLKKSR